jgi:hypothetical protein
VFRYIVKYYEKNNKYDNDYSGSQDENKLIMSIQFFTHNNNSFALKILIKYKIRRI